MRVFSRICAEIDPSFLLLIPGASTNDKLTFLKDQCCKDSAGTSSDVHYQVTENNCVIVTCCSAKDTFSIECYLEKTLLPNLDVNKKSMGSDSGSQTVQSQSSYETVTDDSCNVDDSKDAFQFTDEVEEKKGPLRSAKCSNKRDPGQKQAVKKQLNVKYIEYRKITADEYREEDGKMHCKKCEYFAPSRKRIIEHIRRKHDIPQFECQHCDKKFKTRSDYNKHQKSHPEAETSTQFLVKNRRPDLCCKKCNKTFASLREWANHRESIHKIPTDISQYENNAKKGYREHDGKYFCNQCIFETEKKRYMTAHIQRQHDSVYACPFCEKKFSMKGTCTSHINVHSFCDICGKLMASKGDLQTHVESEHPDNGVKSDDESIAIQCILWGLMKLYQEGSDGVSCNICQKAFTAAKEAESHIQESHDKELFTCTICKETVSPLNEYNDHMKSHIKDDSIQPKAEAFTCIHCGKAYNSKTTLKIHVDQIHGGDIDTGSSDSQEKPAGEAKHPLKCPHCPYVGHLTKYLNEHILRRHGEKKYQCPYCPKKFSTKSVFNVHKQRHVRSGVLNKAAEEEKKDNIYNCPVCQKEFTTKLTLQKHLEQSHPEFDIASSEYMNEVKNSDIFFCKICRKAYCSVPQLRQHFSRDHKDEDNSLELEDLGEKSKELRCSECDYASGSIRNYNDHIVRRHGEKKYQCELCPKKFSTKSSFNSHARGHNNASGRIYSCPLCGKTYMFELSFKNHMTQSHPDYEYAQDGNSTDDLPIQAVCPVCKMAYRYQNSYLAHMERMHPDHSQETIDEGYQLAKDDSLKMDTVETSAVISLDQAIQDLVMDSPMDEAGSPSPSDKPISCQKCNYSTNNPRNLNEHLALRHGEKKFECPMCSKVYPSKGQLKTHVKTHTERHFCEQCGKVTSSLASLKTHIKIVHEGIKRKRPEAKQCPYCLQMLREGYESHVNKHLGILSHVCDVCGKAFAGKPNLVSHQKTHDGKQYPCDICGSKLSSKAHLIRHQKSHKKDEQPQNNDTVVSIIQLETM